MTGTTSGDGKVIVSLAPITGIPQRETIRTVGSKSTITATFEMDEQTVMALQNFLFRIPGNVLRQVLLSEMIPADSAPGIKEATLRWDPSEGIPFLDQKLKELREELLK